MVAWEQAFLTQPQPVVEVFGGLDVSAREIKVARVQGQDQNPTLATFANNAAGHKALLDSLLKKTERVRVCVEASGNYSLDLASLLHAQRQVEVTQPML